MYVKNTSESPDRCIEHLLLAKIKTFTSFFPLIHIRIIEIGRSDKPSTIYFYATNIIKHKLPLRNYKRRMWEPLKQLTLKAFVYWLDAKKKIYPWHLSHETLGVSTNSIITIIERLTKNKIFEKRDEILSPRVLIVSKRRVWWCSCFITRNVWKVFFVKRRC